MKKILLLFILMTTLSFADLTGIGNGKNETEAKNNALSDLSSKIQIEVKSEFNSKSTENNNGYSFEDASNINLRTTNDFLGVDIKVNKISIFKDQYEAVAILSSDKLNLYYNKIKIIDESILTNFRLTDSGSKIEKIDHSDQALEDLKKREKYSYVILALGGQISKPKISKYDIEKRKATLKKDLHERVSVALNVIGDIGEDDRIYFQKELSSSIKDKRIALGYIENGSEDYYIDVNIIENKAQKIPETYIMPEMTNIRINAFMEVIDSYGETLFSQNISGEAEEIEKKQAMDLALDMLKLSFNNNLKVILGE
ncbi:hypothetical protein [Ilyobacter sp.]|uniref:hypothetical protein n=1 Tax=Ilyobacter sp. TaxID=3100343 RepID=UPI0035625879